MSVVGIDLGTTNTVAACLRSGRAHVLADERGQRLLPSVVSFHPNGEVLVGSAARARRVIDPANTVYSHKRLIGRAWGSPEIAQAKQRFAFELREGPGQSPLVHARGKDYTLPEVSAFVLKRARQIAETALGTPVDRAVITVPAHFNELQRASTKVAGRVSGLEVLRILNEPTAAALAYGLGRAGSERVAVYDFGGGTFDCTLLDLSGNVFEVLATAGDSFLGGDDVDGLIAERMAESFLRAHRVDPRADAQLLERLRTAAEEIKIQLSTAETHTVVLKDVAHGLGGSSIHFTFTMSRRDLEAAITPLVERSFKVTQDALALARLTPTSFDKVILVGGSTRIPLVRQRVEAFFGTPPLDRVNPDEVVAIGAAIQAAALTEGQRKERRIPAPPPVPAAARRAATPSDDAPTATAHLGAPPRLGAGTAPGSAPPAARAPAPPQVGARPPGDGAPRKATAPGVAPAARPAGARPPVAAPPPPSGGRPRSATDDDPSFPDLAVPTPFEWMPTSRPAEAPDTTRGPSTTRSAMPSPIGEPEAFATDEYGRPHETATASGGGATGLARPSTAGEFGHVRDLSFVSAPDASGGARDSEDAFGRIRDLSIASSSSETTGSDAITEARRRALDGGMFAPDDGAGAAAMSRGGDGRVEPAPGTSPLRGPPPLRGAPEEAVDLPSVLPTADLPAVARGKQAPPARRPPPTSSPGMGAGGGAAMLGKPPMPVAPQPFGPMERVTDDAPRTAAMPGRAAPAAPPRAPAPPLPASPSAAPPPFAATLASSPMAPQRPHPPHGSAPPHAPLEPSPRHGYPGAPQPGGQAGSGPHPAMPAGLSAGSGPHPAMPAGPAAGAYGSHPPPAYGSHPPPAYGSHPAPPYGSQPPAYGSRPAPPYGSQPPAYGSHPPPAYGSRPAPAYGSQPPAVSGGYPSSPPAAPSGPPMAGAAPFDARPRAPVPPPVGFAAPVLVDVTPRALVVETAGGYTDTIIPRNAKIPSERTRRFATGRDMQTTVRVRVAQGEHGVFTQNTYLGEVELYGLRAAPRGEVVVAVTFEVDADGTLRVRARDVQTGQEARATLTLVGIADESSVVMMINRFAQQPVTGGPSGTAP